MRMHLIFKHKILTAGVVLVAAWMSWYFLAGSSAPSPILSAESASKVPPDAQQLVQSLNDLRSVTLDGAIFTNPSFQALKDFSTPIVPEPVGRADPFAPISAGQGAAVPAASHVAPAH